MEQINIDKIGLDKIKLNKNDRIEHFDFGLGTVVIEDEDFVLIYFDKKDTTVLHAGAQDEEFNIPYEERDGHCWYIGPDGHDYDLDCYVTKVEGKYERIFY